MDENKGYQEDSQSKQDSKLPHLKESFTKEHLIEVGRKGISPFTQIIHKYRGEVSPFIDALRVGFEAAYQELNKEEYQQRTASRVVGNWFSEARLMLEESANKLKEDDPKVFFNYIKEQSNRHPLLMFSSSYLLGLVAGRLSKRQLVDQKTRNLH